MLSRVLLTLYASALQKVGTPGNVYKAIIDSRLRPGTQLTVSKSVVLIVEQNLVGISAVLLVVFYRPMTLHTARYVKT